MWDEMPGKTDQSSNNPYQSNPINIEHRFSLSFHDIFIKPGFLSHLGSYVLSLILSSIGGFTLFFSIGFMILGSIDTFGNSNDSTDQTIGIGILFAGFVILVLPMYGVISTFLKYNKPNIKSIEKRFISLLATPVFIMIFFVISGLAIASGILGIVFPISTIGLTGPLHLYLLIQLNKKMYQSMLGDTNTMFENTTVSNPQTSTPEINPVNPEIENLQKEMEKLREEITNQQPTIQQNNPEIERMAEEIASLRAQLEQQNTVEYVPEATQWRPSPITPEPGRFEGTYLKGGPYIIAFILASLILTSAMGAVFYGLFKIYDKNDDGTSITRQYANEILDCDRALVSCQ